MKHLQCLSLIILALTIAGCSLTGNKSYQTQAQSVPPAKVPAGLSNSSMQNYYPIPNSANGQENPSVLPPGSGMQTQQQQAMAEAQQAQPTAPVTRQAANTVPAATVSGNSLILNTDYSQAWSTVGKALQSSGYKILQQDKAMGSYYVIDSADSQAGLKVNTPIYQVHLKTAGTITEVNVLNEQGQAANGNVSSRILSNIKQNS